MTHLLYKIHTCLRTWYFDPLRACFARIIGASSTISRSWYSLSWNKKSTPYYLIIFFTIVSTIILWSPFLLKVKNINYIRTEGISLQTVIQHWDGPLYIIPAKTLYDKNNSILKEAPMGLSDKYFAAHLPLYPLTIRLLAPFLGYPKAMLASTMLTSILLFCLFYFFVKKLGLTSRPLLLTIVFLFFTPRFFVVHSIGSPEPLFLLLLLLSLYFFMVKNYALAGIMGGLATATKTPGILLFGAYGLYFLEQYLKTKKVKGSWFFIFLIPAGLLAVFLLYWRQYGDFFAYFHSGDNIHLVFPPFSVFNFQKQWISTAWLEEIMFIFFFYLLALVELVKKPMLRPFFYFALVFFAATIFVEHRDIARYSLPILPIALIAFERFFTSKKWLLTLIILLPALYLYAWNFMLYNVAPITNWTPFL
ncbi:MAG TPA: hypothetical protein VJH96_02275 [Patescibacteria group bacterium]|nr:hypothetical protein [Patescibacteria group bacterium]